MLFVLVPSPLVGPFTWSSTADELMARGHEVLLADVSDEGTGSWWQRHATSAAHALKERRGEVVLVGHSGVGALLPLIAQAAAIRPAAYVFVDAGLPQDGRTRLDEIQNENASFADELRAHLAAGGRFPEWTDADLAEIVPDPSVRSRLLSELRPRALDFFDEPIPTPDGWPDAGWAYLQFSEAYDRAAAQARRRGSAFARLDGGHFHMLVDPAAVAEAIIGLARNVSDTPALAALERAEVAFSVVRTGPARSAEESAELQGISLGNLLRTIVVRRGADDYVFALVPGGRQIDWPKLRAFLGVSRLSLPDQAEAREATGYERGAITPFGSRKEWPVIADAAVAELPRIAIGGGARGVNVHVDPGDLIRALDARTADVTRPAGPV